jgi:hypothetical protein
MSITAKYDVEQLMIDIRTKIVADFNTKLAAIVTDKAKNSANIVLTNFKALGGGIIGGAAGDTADKAIDLLGLNASKMKAYDPYMIIKFTGDGAAPINTMGRDTASVLILISLIDPRDYTGEIRMLRYRRALKEMFETMSGIGTNRVSLNAIETLPYLSGPDYWDTTKDRLTWGIGLKLTI